MSTHDYVIANQTGANTRSDLNNAFSAIVSNNSSATEPTTTYAYQWWADTGNDLLKQRNAADSAWISILTLSTGAVSNAPVADDSITLAKMAGGTDGNLITYDASGDPAYVTTGTSGQVLTSGGAGVAPTFQTAAGTTQVSFYAKASGGQSISAATYTKMTYASEIIDTHSAYDTTNSRFTPTIAGYYLFVARASVTNVATSDFYLGVFYKNGSQYTRGGNCKPSANWNALTGSTIMYMNGSSDYVEHYVLTPTALTTEGNTDWFQGVLVS